MFRPYFSLLAYYYVGEGLGMRGLVILWGNKKDDRSRLFLC